MLLNAVSGAAVKYSTIIECCCCQTDAFDRIVLSDTIWNCIKVKFYALQCFCLMLFIAHHSHDANRVNIKATRIHNNIFF